MKKVLKRTFASSFRILAGVPIVSLMVGGLLLFVFGATLRGRCVGLSAVVVGSVLFCSVGYWSRTWFKQIRRRFYAVLLPVGLLLYLVPMMLAPSGGTDDGRVRSCYLHGEGGVWWFSPANVIPEIDQLKVGISLARLRDVDAAEAARLRSLLFPIYEEMDKDADFHALGSAMGLAYRDLFHLNSRVGHYYLFLPETADGERIPCLIFLHGMGGNMKACLWVLARLAARTKCAVIAPTFGVGNWDQAGSGEFVVAVAHEALATLPLDPKRMFLMGYSNGAMGVTRAAIEEPTLFRGLIYLSAITADESVSTDQLPAEMRNCKTLFLHGGRDQRIPPGVIEASAVSLKQRGWNVRLKTYDNEDHYLLFSQPDRVLADIAECIEAD